MAFPEFEDQLDLPTDAVQECNLWYGEHLGGDVGHKEGPIHQSECFLAEAFLLASSVRDFLRNRQGDQPAGQLVLRVSAQQDGTLCRLSWAVLKSLQEMEGLAFRGQRLIRVRKRLRK